MAVLRLRVYCDGATHVVRLIAVVAVLGELAVSEHSGDYIPESCRSAVDRCPSVSWIVAKSLGSRSNFTLKSSTTRIGSSHYVTLIFAGGTKRNDDSADAIDCFESNGVTKMRKALHTHVNRTYISVNVSRYSRINYIAATKEDGKLTCIFPLNISTHHNFNSTIYIILAEGTMNTSHGSKPRKNQPDKIFASTSRFYDMLLRTATNTTANPVNVKAPTAAGSQVSELTGRFEPHECGAVHRCPSVLWSVTRSREGDEHLTITSSGIRTEGGNCASFGLTDGMEIAKEFSDLYNPEGCAAIVDCPSVSWLLKESFNGTSNYFTITSRANWVNTDSYISFAFVNGTRMEDALFVVDCYKLNSTAAVGMSRNMFDSGTKSNVAFKDGMLRLTNFTAKKENGTLTCSFSFAGDINELFDAPLYLMLAEGTMRITGDKDVSPRKNQHSQKFVSGSTFPDMTRTSATPGPASEYNENSPAEAPQVFLALTIACLVSALAKNLL